MRENIVRKSTRFGNYSDRVTIIWFGFALRVVKGNQLQFHYNSLYIKLSF